MVNNKEQTLSESDVPYRRRGRPAGKNRVPLSQEERRARNAQYERERRNETAEVMSQLIVAANCDPNISNAELLATVIHRIQRASRKKSEDITELERINANLEAQIATLQDRLGLDDAALELLDGEDSNLETVGVHSNSDSISITNPNNCNSDKYNLRKQRKKRKRSERLSSGSIQQEKRTKTQSESYSVDSGIEMRGHTVSPPAVQDQITQYLVQMEQQQLPEEITEEQDYDVSQAHMELQTELYNQIYNSESQSSVETMSQYVATLSAQSQSIPSMESLSRSLIVVPSIIPPQQVPPDNQEATQPEMTSLQNVEPPCDFQIATECDFLQQNADQQPSLDFLTDTEKGLLSEWIGTDYLETSEFCDDPQMQIRSYPIDDMLSGY